MSEYNLYNGDCLEVMKQIPDKSIDLILCDLPYGTTACSWDSVIPFEPLWEHYKRIIKDGRAIVLFSQQPFTSKLICSNIEWWKYNWVWEKDNGTNFLNSKFQPLKVTEDICVFGNGASSFVKSGITLFYSPQKSEGKPYSCVSGKQKPNSAVVRDNGAKEGGVLTVNNGERMPKNIIRFNRDRDKVHPTQKPVALLEYLIRTYTNKNETVLDNCMGSGSTGVACMNTDRNFIGIELDEEYYKVAEKRIKEAGCRLF
jgi:site-specific DNA-methyltransferase (adenine-specific)